MPDEVTIEHLALQLDRVLARLGVIEEQADRHEARAVDLLRAAKT